MPRWLRNTLVAVVVLLVVAGGAWSWLTARTTVPATTDFVIDLTEIRRLAALLPGDRPSRVNHEQVATAPLPRGAVFAGQSMFEPLRFSHGAYQVVFPDGFLIIDSAFDRAQLASMSSDGTFDDAAYDVVQKALGSARTIVITHEHPDHIGGIARFRDPDALVGRLVLTKEQLANRRALDHVDFAAVLRERVKPLDYERYHPIAPGVVLVKARGHSPGSQMVFVGLANGTELLFLGDVAWHLDQVRQLWYRPRIVTDFFLGEDRAAVMGQFRALHSLLDGKPTVQLVPSHDAQERHALIEAGTIGDHFQLQ
jgi:glyoxylase-like metal-dependent hydrolase (beta-lactamase superfamily II)